jgi:hypothetical protein
MKTFKEWVISEGKDIFGFEKDRGPIQKEVEDERPIIPINAEFLVEEMMKNEVNGLSPFSAYADQIQWGTTPGAVRMVISPLGSFKSIMRKLQKNLLGEDVWVCKRIVPYKDIIHSDFSFDENFSAELFEEIKKVYDEPIEAADSSYKGLEALTIKLYNESVKKNVLPKIFIPMGIRQIKKNENYIIYFECKGHGVETPGSGRLEVFMINMSYDPKTGMIRSFGHDVQSPKKGHVWYPQPSEWDENFSPNQREKDIILSITGALKTY